ncbi:MAG: potassium-transporting ATPase subunit KdpA [Ignavibacteria bacterium]|nr:potassium-transporting ATPase subunit KdpA [Ignavibacteria bacterium]
MNTEILSPVLIIVVTFIIAVPLGKYIAKVFKGEKTFLDFFAPLENFIFRIAGTDPQKEMDWKENIKALLTINFLWFLWAIVILAFQNLLFMNG